MYLYCVKITQIFGCFMNMDETAEQCAKRELEEETGLRDVSVEQFHTFSDVNRDPRERVITVAHYALVRLSEVKGGDDATSTIKCSNSAF